MSPLLREAGPCLADCGAERKVSAPYTVTRKGQVWGPYNRYAKTCGAKECVRVLLQRALGGKTRPAEVAERGMATKRETGRFGGGGREAGWKHTDETRAKIRAARALQPPMSEEARERQGISLSKYIAENGMNVGSRAGSQLEQCMASLLEYAGVEFEGQRQIGRYVVDFYLPESGAVIEADGVYWHQNTDREIKRDAYLLSHQEVTTVTHITDVQLRAAGWLRRP